jgi:hypothetical protein
LAEEMKLTALFEPKEVGERLRRYPHGAGGGEADPVQIGVQANVTLKMNEEFPFVLRPVGPCPVEIEHLLEDRSPAPPDNGTHTMERRRGGVHIPSTVPVRVHGEEQAVREEGLHRAEILLAATRQEGRPLGDAPPLRLGFPGR